MRSRILHLIVGIPLLLIAGWAGLSVARSGRTVAASATEANRAARPVLVELFTSEGCSSCPPADALLREVDGTQTDAGQWIVGISEHVTYWNSLGWSDPFSSPVYTGRQNAYGGRLGLDSVYTPQMVINGTEQIVGSDRSGLRRALRIEGDRPAVVTLHILSMSTLRDSLTVKFDASGDSSSSGADIIAVLTDDVDQSSVLHGENSGRTLTHVSVARSMTRVAKLQTDADRTVQISLPPAFSQKHGHHLILFAQARRSGPVLAVDTRPLEP